MTATDNLTNESKYPCQHTYLHCCLLSCITIQAVKERTPVECGVCLSNAHMLIWQDVINHNKMIMKWLSLHATEDRLRTVIEYRQVSPVILPDYTLPEAGGRTGHQLNSPTVSAEMPVSANQIHSGMASHCHVILKNDTTPSIRPVPLQAVRWPQKCWNSKKTPLWVHKNYTCLITIKLPEQGQHNSLAWRGWAQLYLACSIWPVTFQGVVDWRPPRHVVAQEEITRLLYQPSTAGHPGIQKGSRGSVICIVILIVKCYWLK